MSENIKNRYDFMIVVEAKNCNPNGDPDAGNAPRQDFETGYGIMSDVCIKRKIRDYVQYTANKAGHEIVIKQGANINRAIAEAAFKVNGIENADDFTGKDSKSTKKVNPKVYETSQYMCKKYWDVRTFGGVLGTGKNAGQVRGAVQIGMASSLDPISPTCMTITRVAYVEDKCDDKKEAKTIEDYDLIEANISEDKRRTMGTKYYIPYGLYIFHGHISPAFAEQTGFTEDDLNLFWESVIQMFDFNVSSSKTGLSLALPLVIFKHVGTQNENNSEKEREARLGCASAQKLFKLLSVKKKEGVEYPRSLDDYNIRFDFDHIPNGIEVGFKEMPFSDIVWNDKSLISSYITNNH